MTTMGNAYVLTADFDFPIDPRDVTDVDGVARHVPHHDEAAELRCDAHDDAREVTA